MTNRQTIGSTNGTSLSNTEANSSYHEDIASYVKFGEQEDEQNRFPKQKANEIRLNLSVLNENQTFVHNTVLNDFSAIGTVLGSASIWHKLQLADQIKDKIDSALFDTELIGNLSTYQDQIDCETVRLSMQKQRLTDEVACLNEQYECLKDRHQCLKDKIVEMEIERDMQQFIHHIRHIDREEPQEKIRIIQCHLAEDSPISELISPKLKGIYHLVMRYLSEGKLDVTVTMCSRLLEEQTEKVELSPVDRGVVNFLLSIILQQKNRMRDALTHMEETLNIFDAALGEQHNYICFILSQLADMNLEMGYLDAAEQCWRRVISIKSNHSDDDGELLKTKVNLCGLLHQTNRFDEASKLGETILAELNSTCNPQDAMVIKTRLIMIKAAIQTKQMDKAYEQIKTTFTECFPHIGLVIIDQLESDQVYLDESHILHHQLTNRCETELVSILRDFYETRGNGKAVSALNGLLNSKL